MTDRSAWKEQRIAEAADFAQTVVVVADAGLWGIDSSTTRFAAVLVWRAGRAGTRVVQTREGYRIHHSPRSRALSSAVPVPHRPGQQTGGAP